MRTTRFGTWVAALVALVVVGVAAPAGASEEAPHRITGADVAPVSGLVAVGGTMYDFQDYWFNDVADWWNSTGADSGAYYVFPAAGEPFTTACGNGPDDTAAFYCELDDTVVFSQELATRIWEGTVDLTGRYGGEAAGDMGVVYALAHEYAHNLQQEQGLLALGRPVIDVELHADCWAGVYARAKQDAGQLDATDIPEAIATAARVGDYDYANPTFHGTPEQRVAAFDTGFASGVPAGCTGVLHGVRAG